MTPRQANALTAVGLAGLLATVALTAPRWAALLRTPAATVEARGAWAEPAPPRPRSRRRERDGASTCVSTSRPRTATGLLPEEREVAFSPDLAQQLRTVVEELARARRPASLPTLPAGTRVLEVFVQAGASRTSTSRRRRREGSPAGRRRSC